MILVKCIKLQSQGDDGIIEGICNGLRLTRLGLVVYKLSPVTKKLFSFFSFGVSFLIGNSLVFDIKNGNIFYCYGK